MDGNEKVIPNIPVLSLTGPATGYVPFILHVHFPVRITRDVGRAREETIRLRHEIDGVRKEKERLTASYCHILHSHSANEVSQREPNGCEERARVRNEA